MSYADCGKTTAVMVEMRPGVDRKAWWLCVYCWCASAREAEIDRKERQENLARREGRDRQTHNKPKIGAHG